MSDFKLVQLLNPIQIALRLLGEYDNATAYNSGDAVTYLGGTYYSKGSTTGNLPTDTLYWGVLSEKGEDGVNNSDVLRSLSSGVIEGGIVSTNVDTTKIDITAGYGTIVDTNTDPTTPVIYNVSWTTQTGLSPTYLTTNTFSYVGVNKTGSIVYWQTRPTNEQLRENILLCRLGHRDLTVINNIVASYTVMNSPVSQLRDLMLELGPIKEGNTISANGTNLSIDKSAGNLFFMGANYPANPNDPNTVTFSIQSPVSFQYRTQTGVATSTITSIDPTNYDLAGVVTAVGGTSSRSTNQRVYLFPNGNIRIQYGQTVYTNLANAIAGISTESFNEFVNIAEEAILIGIISLRRDATDLSNSTQANFTQTSRFGELSGGSGSSGSLTLQSAYNASSDPEIVTDTTRGALTIKRGSASDADIVLEIQNATGATNFSVKGSGEISNNSFTTARNTTAPNATVPVHSISSSGTETDIDFVAAPKGLGGFSLQIADNTTTGGNKRGPGATDLQTSRTSALQVASGTNSFATGIRNTVSGTQAGAIGSTNTASGGRAVAINFGTTASGNDSFASGNSSIASGVSSMASGGGSNTYSSLGRHSHAGGFLGPIGDSQWSRFSLRQSTTNATPAVLTANAAAAAATNIVVLSNQTSFYFTGTIIGKQSGSTNAAVWKVEGFVTRGANAAATTLVTSSVTAYSNVPAWTTPTVVADTTLGGLTFTVTGVAATNIRWHANIETNEILYA